MPPPNLRPENPAGGVVSSEFVWEKIGAPPHLRFARVKRAWQLWQQASKFDGSSLSGSLIDRLEHHDSSTGQVAWDMLSEHTRAIAPGLYIYVVENLDTGEIQRGKLVILK